MKLNYRLSELQPVLVTGEATHLITHSPDFLCFGDMHGHAFQLLLMMYNCTTWSSLIYDHCFYVKKKNPPQLILVS